MRGEGVGRDGREKRGMEKGKGGSEGEGERRKGVRGREGDRRNREERGAKERKGSTYKGRNTQLVIDASRGDGGSIIHSSSPPHSHMHYTHPIHTPYALLSAH